MSGKYWLNWQEVSTSWLRITDHALLFLCFPSDLWTAFCCRKPLNHVAHTELQAIRARTWVRNALTLIQDRYSSCRLPLFFSMPKLFLRAVLTREEVADKQCLHAVQELFNVRAQPVIGTIVRPSTDKLQRPGGNHYETICQEGCNVLFARAVESPACGFPEEPALALSWGNVINHRSALSPQNRGLKLKLQAESSAGKQVHRHTKRKKNTLEGKEGRSVHLPSEGAWVSLETKWSEELLLHAMVWSSLMASFSQTGYWLMKQNFCLDQPPQKSGRPLALNTKQGWPEVMCIVCWYSLATCIEVCKPGLAVKE